MKGPSALQPKRKARTMFRDRDDAANRLAERLKGYKGKNPLILAIPRGAVPMAKIIADKLGGEFDVVLVRKLRAPYQPELAIGSVDESGWTYIAPYAASMGADEDYIACLLYTSPSPRDGLLSRMPSSA